ncbi:hypothetical protein BFP77_14705 [Maribacter sp. 4U21]|uniref:helix-turn-helix domain-containing protein n=1 Tax=Maribacter sp. 4U21 TaxID=1889779 RepID=UPI000C1536AC|nr:AraC family transcriptional regulator [Maribacter sp. 4U21]PIB26207.1 hypothetical protein BFP77_14705 [Maribacter sp. 4U21]
MTKTKVQESYRMKKSQKIILDCEKQVHLIRFSVKELKTVALKCYGLMFIDNAHLNHSVADNVPFYLFRPNSSVFLGDLNTLYNSSNIFFLSFSSTCLTEIKLEYSNYIIKRKNMKKELYFSTDNYSELFLGSLKILLSLDDSNKEFILNYKVQEFVSYLIKTYGKEVLDFIFTNSNFEPSGFKNLMWKQVLKNHTLEELAYISNMSVSKFKRTFKDIFDDTPINWFREQNILESCKLLENTKISISEISEFIGYQNPSSFIKVFKKYNGITPNEYRERFLVKEK